MRIVELNDDDGVLYGSRKNAYKGPPASFSFCSFQVLGAMQLFCGISLLILGIVQVVITSADRAVFLVSGGVIIWCPMFAIATGIVGVSMSRKRYWEATCLRNTFIALSSISFFVMGGVIALIVFIQFYYYGFISLKPAETFSGLVAHQIALQPGTPKKGYTAFLSLMIIFAGLEMILAVISAFLGCCQYTIEPDSDGVVLRRNNSTRSVKTSIMPQQQLMSNNNSVSPFTTAIGQPLPQQQLPSISGGQEKYVYVEQPYVYDPNTNTATPLGNQGMQGSMRGMPVGMQGMQMGIQGMPMGMQGIPMGMQGMPMISGGSLDGLYNCRW